MERLSISKATIPLWLLIFGILVWLYLQLDPKPRQSRPKPAPTHSRELPTPPSGRVPGDALLDGYADPATPPIEDLRKLQHVVSGYFSVTKDSSHFPIGGNEDLSAALKGENPNREIFVRPESRVFSRDGLLIDRWGSPVIVHPEAWRQVELRSAGPDKVPYNEDDLILQPDGTSRSGRDAEK